MDQSSGNPLLSVSLSTALEINPNGKSVLKISTIFDFF